MVVVRVHIYRYVWQKRNIEVYKGHLVDALAYGGDEGRVRLRKARWSCQKALIPGCPNGGTHSFRVFQCEYIALEGKPGELKHLSTQRKGNQRDSVSSGERTRTRPVALT